jgi:hypothetical protein
VLAGDRLGRGRGVLRGAADSTRLDRAEEARREIEANGAYLTNQRWWVAAIRLRAWIEGFSSAQTTLVARVQPLALPAALVEVEDRAGLLAEARVAREIQERSRR